MILNLAAGSALCHSTSLSYIVLSRFCFQELQNIFCHLHDLEALRSLREQAIREISKSVRYEKREANEILYW